MNIIDLRSDTVTKPTPKMMEAMFKAKLGDDVLEEDPTVKELEKKTADLFGAEAGLFCPSGTMSNQIAIKLHTQPMSEVICDKLSHIYNYETGGIAFNSAASVRTLNGDRGRFTATELLENINPDNIHHPISSLVCIENTTNKGGGAIWDFEEIKKIHAVCKINKLKFHLDGARIFNALAETKTDTKEFGKIFDTISICFSKGLGAPVGSVLLGSNQEINRSKRIRKVLGGGMRQAGFLAACGIYALDHHVERIKTDHQNAKKLEHTIAKLPFITQLLPVETNILVFDLDDSYPKEKFIEKLNKKKIKVIGFGKQTVRMVTHLDIDDKMIDEVIKTLSLL